MTTALHPDVQSLLDQARHSYQAQEYARALDLDQQALDRALKVACRLGELRSRRFIGLCQYRLTRSEDSEATLRALLPEADQGWPMEGLRARVHLGATLRKTGNPVEGLQVLEEALHQASAGPGAGAAASERLDLRARLLGSLGAALDDLGDERAAGEAYGRYHEALLVLDDPRRLSNASGLLSRSLRRRGEAAQALRWAHEALTFAHRAQDPTREANAWMYIAQARAELGQVDDALVALGESEAAVPPGRECRLDIRRLGARARIHLGAGALGSADQATSAALALLGTMESREHEVVGRVHELAAEVAGASGLHGEALHHLALALNAHVERFPRRAVDESTERRLSHRRDQLVDLATRLLTAQGEVGRGGDEVQRVKAAMDRLCEVVSAPQTERPPSPDLDVRTWRTQIDCQARTRWKHLVGPASGEILNDLVLVDVLAHGPVGDLPRSLLLLLVVLERELHHRLVSPSEGRTPSMGTITRDPSTWRSAIPPEQHEALVGSLGALHVGLNDIQGKPLKAPIALRNDLAHGRLTALSRLQADGYRRCLTLGKHPTLRTVLGLPSRGG